MTKLFFSLAFLALMSLPLANGQNADSLQLKICNSFWKTGIPVHGMVVSQSGGMVSNQLNGDSTCAQVLFSPAIGAKAYCPKTNIARNDVRNGVTVADLIQIRLDLLGITPFPSGFSFLAGDINQSLGVTTLDVLLMSKLLIGEIDALPAPAWQTIAVDLPNGIIDPGTFSTLPCIYKFDPLKKQDSTTVFVYKTGDIDGDATPTHPYTIPNNFPNGALDFPIINVNAGDSVLFTVRAGGAGFEASGLQLSLGCNTDFGSFTEIQPSTALKNIGFQTVSLVIPKAANILLFTTGLPSSNKHLFAPGEALFTLKVKATKTTSTDQFIGLLPGILPAAYADGDVRLHQMIGQFQTVATHQVPLMTANISPNPFADRVVVDLDQSLTGNTSIEWTDVAGRVLYSEARNLGSGTQTLELSGANLPKGLLFLRIAGQNAAFLGKLVHE